MTPAEQELEKVRSLLSRANVPAELGLLGGLAYLVNQRDAFQLAAANMTMLAQARIPRTNDDDRTAEAKPGSDQGSRVDDKSPG